MAREKEVIAVSEYGKYPCGRDADGSDRSLQVGQHEEGRPHRQEQAEHAHIIIELLWLEYQRVEYEPQNDQRDAVDEEESQVHDRNMVQYEVRDRDAPCLIHIVPRDYGQQDCYYEEEQR